MVRGMSERARTQAASPAAIDEGSAADPLARALRLVDVLKGQERPLAEDVFRLHGVLARAAKQPSPALGELLLGLIHDAKTAAWSDTRERRTDATAVQLMQRMGYPYAFQLTPEELSLERAHPFGPRSLGPLVIASVTVALAGSVALTVPVSVATALLRGLATPLLGELGLELLAAFVGSALATAYAARGVALARTEVPPRLLARHALVGVLGFAAAAAGAWFAGDRGLLAALLSPVLALGLTSAVRWQRARRPPPAPLPRPAPGEIPKPK